MRDVEVRRQQGTGPAGRGHSRALRLGLAANHGISPFRIIPYVFTRLQQLPAGSTVLLRRPRKAKAGLFELNVAEMATSLGYTVEWYEPDEGGSHQTYRRDFELVEAADQIECFFAIETPMEGGTGHLVESAMMRGVPVYAWTIDDHGHVDRLGEIET